MLNSVRKMSWQKTQLWGLYKTQDGSLCSAGGGLLRNRILVVGPVYPLSGGIAQHVAAFAQRLQQEFGAMVSIESWRSQYPSFLHRAQVTVTGVEAVEIPIACTVARKLQWFSPFSWIHAGIRNRKSDVSFFNVATPFHAIPFAFITMFLSNRCVKIAIVHNALPHERSPFDRLLLRILVAVFPAFLVHDVTSEKILRDLGGPRKAIERVSLPNPWSFRSTDCGEAGGPGDDVAQGPVRALFFGNVRPYKGLPALLEAMVGSPGIELTVAGNFWGQEASIAARVGELGLARRVTLKPGYVDRSEIPELFAQADVVVLPYLSGTASVIPQIAFSFGKPVIATEVGSIAELVRDSENGMIIPPSDPGALARALMAFTEDSSLRQKLSEGAKLSILQNGWSNYVSIAMELAGRMRADREASEEK